MNIRERFLATMAFEPVDRGILWEWDYWEQTLREWQSQGAPLVQMDETVNREGGGWDPFSMALFPDLPKQNGAMLPFELDPGLRRVPVNSFICPRFEYEILDETADTIIARDERGHIRQDRKGQISISNIIKPLVSGREDWERVKAERLQLSMANRLPDDWAKLRESYKDRDFVLAVGGHSGLAGFYSPARYLMGPEHLMYSFYDQPDLVRDIMNHLADLQVFVFDHVLKQIDVDLAFVGEDMAYKNGPFISPAMFREFMLPCYKKLASLLRDYGVNILFVDSDGDIRSLIPLFMEGGVTAVGPAEVAAQMDVVELRKAFPRLQIIGGIDKRRIAAGKAEIDLELKRKLPGLLSLGGYIPCCDHAVPPDISWENFCYYRQRIEQFT